MNSGLRDRNNIVEIKTGVHNSSVSMESGLRDRNNFDSREGVVMFLGSQWSPVLETGTMVGTPSPAASRASLNEVRP